MESKYEFETVEIPYEESAAGKMQKELEELRKQVADYDAKEDQRHREEAANSEKRAKKDYRHDFKVAAFSVAFTLLLEHIQAIIEFIYKLIIG